MKLILWPMWTANRVSRTAIDEIQGNYRKAADTKRRILELLTKEWGFSEETVVHETEQEIERLMERALARNHA